MKLNNKFVPYIALALIVFLVWGRTLWFNYIYLDDNAIILNNLGFLQHIANLPKLFLSDVFLNGQNQIYYRPLLPASLMLNAIFAGDNPFWYHLTNIWLHIFAVWLVYCLMLKLSYKKMAAFCAGIIFAIHPALTAPIAWIVGRNETLATIFIAAGAIAGINFIQSSKYRYLVLYILTFSLGAFTKELSLALPLVLIAYSIIISKKKLFTYENSAIVIVSALIVWFYWQMRTLAITEPIPMTVSNIFLSLFNNLPATLLYFGKAVLPVNLSVLPNIIESHLIWGWVSFGLTVLCLIIVKNKNRRLLIFGAIWFLLFLLPSFIRPDPTTLTDLYEHRLYLPFLGLLILFLELGLKQFNRSNANHLIIAGVTGTFFVITALSYSSYYQDRLSFWNAAVSGSPSSPLAHRNLGAMYYLDGALAKAKPHFEKALEINKNEPMAHNNLGLIYLAQNKLDEAQKEFEAEIAINPRWETAYFNLGLVYARQNKNDDAKAMWQRTLQINPNYSDARRLISN